MKTTESLPAAADCDCEPRAYRPFAEWTSASVAASDYEALWGHPRSRPPSAEPIERMDTWTEYNEDAAYEWGALWSPVLEPLPAGSAFPFGSSAASSSKAKDGAAADADIAVSGSPAGAQEISAVPIPVRLFPRALEAMAKEKMEASKDPLKSPPRTVASAIAAAPPMAAATFVDSPTLAAERKEAAKSAAATRTECATHNSIPAPSSTRKKAAPQASPQLNEYPAQTASRTTEETYAKSDPSRKGRRRKLRRGLMTETDTEAMDMSPEVIRCMDDEELTQALEAGGPQREGALLALHGTVVRRSFEPKGCRVVQMALKTASPNIAAELAAELQQHVREGTFSPHCNYVIQKVVELLPVESSAFVVKEIVGKGAIVARHRFGCRIMCRIFEHTMKTTLTSQLAEEVLDEAEDLCRHSYARYVVHTLLEHGSESHRCNIAKALKVQLPKGPKHHNTISVIEHAMTFCSDGDKAEIAEILVAEAEDGVGALAKSHVGPHVLRAALRIPADGSQGALAASRGAQLSAQRGAQPRARRGKLAKPQVVDPREMSEAATATSARCE